MKLAATESVANTNSNYTDAQKFPKHKFLLGRNCTVVLLFHFLFVAQTGEPTGDNIDAL